MATKMEMPARGRGRTMPFKGVPSSGSFWFGSVLGQGAYAKVFHARLKEGRMEFAVKVMDQGFIRQENKSLAVLTERRVMSRLMHPNIVRFYCSFMDAQNLYLVMELCKGGDMFDVIKSESTRNRDLGIPDTACSVELTQFYVAELVSALEYMHSKHVIHRDLKPDNLLLSASGHLKVTDFGTAMDQDDRESARNQFCGTVSYVSPEVLHDHQAGRPSDLWALGCIIFQMLTGKCPFAAENDYLTFQLILHHSSVLTFPASIPESARNLITQLLVQEPTERLGAAQDDTGYRALKAHPFFDGIDWENLQTQKPPYHPQVKTLPEPHLDGAMEYWTVAEHFGDGMFPARSTDASSYSQSYGLRQSMPSGGRCVDIPPWMLDNEQVLYEAKVRIHSVVLSRSRQVLLTDLPRLVILGAWTSRFKRDIVLTKESRFHELGSHTFQIISPSGTFRITDRSTPSHNWIRLLSEAVAQTTASQPVPRPIE